MIIITGQVELKEECREQAVKLAQEHSQRSRSEDGCISHNCYLNAEQGNQLHFFEKWRDMAAVKTHFAVPESSQFVQEISALAVTSPQIEIFEAGALDV